MKTIQDQVHERMGELEALMEELSVEFEQLKRIAGLLAATNGSTGSAPARPRRRAASKAPAAPAAKAAPKAARPPRSGNRAQQALDLIAAQPGLSAADLADSMRMKRNYLYRVLPALEKEGKITKHGKGYHPAEAKAPAPLAA